MIITIAEKIFIKPASNQERELIAKTFRETLVFTDPATEENNQLLFGVPRTIALFRFNKKTELFEIPRGRADQIEVLQNRGCNLEKIIDKRQVGRKINLKTNFELRDDIQKGAYNAYLNQKDNVGIINLSCGLGNIQIAV